MVDDVLKYLPSTPPSPDEPYQRPQVPRVAGAPIVEKLKTFWRMSERAFRKHYDTFATVYGMMAHETDLRSTTLTDVTRIIYGGNRPDNTISNADIYAVHRALGSNYTGFRFVHQVYREVQLVQIRPKREVRLVRMVQEWFREYQESVVAHVDEHGDSHDVPSLGGRSELPMHRFLVMARQVIEASRRKRPLQSTGFIGPDMSSPSDELPSRAVDDMDGSYPTPFAVETGVRFTETDKTILSYLDAMAIRNSIHRTDDLVSLAFMIVRATGMYGGMVIATPTVATMLQEMGVYPPWVNKSAKFDLLALPLKGSDQPEPGDIHKAGPSVLAENGLTDSMQGRRKDWKRLTAYCIDSANALELDDGISIEREPGSNAVSWVHVHVAHPTAFIPPTHRLAQAAATQSMTVYTPEKVYPLLPRHITQAGLSLAPDSPAVTISAKLDHSGTILETKLTPSIVRKVVSITPSTVDEVLGVPELGDRIVITAGPEFASRARTCVQSTKALTKSQKADLKALATMAEKLRLKRVAGGADWFPGVRAEIAVFATQDLIATDLSQLDRPCLWAGDPSIQFSVPRYPPDYVPSQKIGAHATVTEVMILAGQVVSHWCAERGIPVLYRGSRFVSEDGRPKAANKTTLVESFYSVTPSPHEAMGLDMYTRATSPLRRFEDMIQHWQVDVALRHELETGRKWGSPSTAGQLPFSQLALKKHLPRLQYRTRLFAALDTRSQRHWVCQLLFRAMMQGARNMPETLECYVIKELDPSLSLGPLGILKLFTLSVEFDLPDTMRSSDLKLYDEWEVKISSVNVYRGIITVTPLRRLRRAEEVSPMEFRKMDLMKSKS